MNKKEQTKTALKAVLLQGLQFQREIFQKVIQYKKDRETELQQGTIETEIRLNELERLDNYLKKEFNIKLNDIQEEMNASTGN